MIHPPCVMLFFGFWKCETLDDEAIECLKATYKVENDFRENDLPEASENNSRDGACVNLKLTLMQSIWQSVDRRLIRGRCRCCFNLIVVFVSIFISTQIQFSTDCRHAARRCGLFWLPQFHVYLFPLGARVCLYQNSRSLLQRKRKINFLLRVFHEMEEIFSGTFSQYFEYFWFIHFWFNCSLESFFLLFTRLRVEIISRIFRLFKLSEIFTVFLLHTLTDTNDLKQRSDHLQLTWGAKFSADRFSCSLLNIKARERTADFPSLHQHKRALSQQRWSNKLQMMKGLVRRFI